MSPRHQHGHPYSFDAPISVVTSIQYHQLAEHVCAWCGRPSEVVRVLRMNPEGTARCGTPTLAGQLCYGCATTEQRQIKELHGFVLDEEKFTFFPSRDAKVLRIVDVSARPKSDTLVTMPTPFERIAPAPVRPLHSREAALLHALAAGPRRGISLGRWAKTARLLRDRGMVVILDIDRGAGRPKRTVRLTPFGEQVAAFLPAKILRGRGAKERRDV